MRIAVVGGGVTGCSVAWHLSERGLGEVTLYERDRVGSGTTWHSAGNITWKPIDDNDAQVFYMYDLVDRFEAGGVHSTGWVKTGRLFIARQERDMDQFVPMADAARERGLGGRFVTPHEAAELHPLLDPTAFHGAWLNELSGRLNPADLTACYLRAARAAGATIAENCTVNDVRMDGGRVRTLLTSQGEHEVDAVVICGGLWSPGIVSGLSVPLAQWACQHFYVIADMPERLARQTPSFVSPRNLIYGREEVGGLLVGCFDEAAICIEPGALPEPFTFTLMEPNWDKFAEYFEGAAELFPALSDAPIRQFVNGPEAFTPDGDPLIGPVREVDGLYVCSGMNSRGVTLSGASGHIIADMIEGVTPRFEASAYDPQRFGEKPSDTTWLKQQVSGTPSRYYIEANRL